MRLDVNKVLKDIDGNPMLANSDGDYVVLRKVIVDALLAPFQDEMASISGEEKMKRWKLAQKVHNSPDLCELTIEEAGLIKKLVGKGYGPVTCGQVWEMIEEVQSIPDRKLLEEVNNGI